MVTRQVHNHLMCHPKSKNVCTHPAGELLDVLTVVGEPSLPSACDKEAAETQHLLLNF
jgi:hypothetical protein